MRTRVLLVATVLALSACSDDGGGDEPTEPHESNSSVPATEERLPIGKDDLPLDASDYLSPEGFEPELEIALGRFGLTGWTSVHRGADGFDLGLPNPDADAPLVAVVFLVPPEGSAEKALEAVRRRAIDAGSEVSDDPGPFPPLAGHGIEVRDGQGQLVASRDGGIALDAMPGARLQVWAAGHGVNPMLIVVFTPDATLSAEADDVVQELAASVVFS